jgi:hypothetical protein
VAWDFCARGVRSYPFAPERKVYDNWSKHRGILALELPKDYSTARYLLFEGCLRVAGFSSGHVYFHYRE